MFYQYHTKDQTLQLFYESNNQIKTYGKLQHSFFLQDHQSFSQQLSSISSSSLLSCLFLKTSQMVKIFSHTKKQGQTCFFDSKSQGDRKLVRFSHQTKYRIILNDWPSRSLTFLQFVWSYIFLFAYLRFLSLSPEDYVTCTAIGNFDFIELFSKNYKKGKNCLIHLPTSRVISSGQNSQQPKNKAVLESLRYAATSYPQLYIDSDKFSPKMMLNWLEEISSMHVFELSSKQENNFEQNYQWFNSKTFHPLSSWLANEIQKNILISFFKKTNHHCSIKKFKNYVQQNYSNHHLVKLFAFTMSDIERDVLEDNQQQILLLKTLEESFLHQNQEKLMTLNEQQGKKQRKRKKKQKRSQSLQNLDNNSVIHQIQIPINQETNQQSQQKNQSQRKHQDIEQQNKQEVNEQKINPQADSPLTQMFKSSKRTCCDSFSEEQVEKSSLSESKDEKFIQLQDKQDEISSPLFSQDQKKKKRKRRNGKNTSLVQQFKEKVTHTILNKQLDSFLDSLSIESNKKFDSKVLAFQRVRYFIKSMFPYSETVLFGSNAVGLSLPTSDIDLMLVGLCYSSREELCDYLAQIEVCINSMGWVISCSTYPQAKVPILKLQVNTSINYLQSKIRNDPRYLQYSCMPCHLDLKDPSKGSIIKVDITISSDINQISPTTELMRCWLTDRPSIQRVLLALKYILAVRGYSQNFKGGIGSYCLFIMVAAYFQQFNEQRQQSDCQILLDLLSFYGQLFQNHLKIVTLSQNRPCFLSHHQILQNYQLAQQLAFKCPLKIINPLNGKLLSGNCYQYLQIKTQWRRISRQIKKISEIIQTQISNSFINTAQITKLLANQKSFEKWTNKLQAKMDITIAKILAGDF